MLIASGLLIFSVLANTAATFLDEAKKHMSLGKFQDALVSYEKALDPKNHVTFFRRAAAYLILGKNDLAIRDFDSVLELKSDNHQARLKRATLLLYQGQIEKSISDLTQYLSSLPNDLEAMEKATTVQKTLNSLHGETGLCDLEALDLILQICPKFVELLERRSKCHLQNGDVEIAIGDLARAMKIQPHENKYALQLAGLYFSIGEMESGLNAVKECLRQDPEHKECKRLFRKIKAVKKQFTGLENLQQKRKWNAIISILFTEENFVRDIEEIGSISLKKQVYMFACEAYHWIKNHENVISYCTKVLDINPDFLEARIFRGESYLAKDEFEAAKNDFRTVHEADRQNQRAFEGYRKAETLLKRSNMKDYYKILNVSRTATQKEIKKAYRKQAQYWHPDKYSGDLSAEEIQKKMSDINSAYEVLRNEESREQYDNGHDPNDPNNGHQGGHNPFEGFQGFNGFPGFNGGGQFHFKFQ